MPNDQRLTTNDRFVKLETRNSPLYRSPVNIPALLEPFITGLTSAQLAQVSTYLDLLMRWNAKMNLTSIRNPEQIVSRHCGESFFLASKLFGAGGFLHLPTYQLTNLLMYDLGSGAGFPAIPLKIHRPDVTITLIEANHRKAVFLREVLRALELDAEVKNVRAEDLPPASADLVTLRAVEKFDSILPTAARLVRNRKEDGYGTRDREEGSGKLSPEPEEGVPGPFLPLERAGVRTSPTECSGSLNSQPLGDPAHRPPSTVHGLSLLIGHTQVARAREILPNWRFHPEIPIPKSQNRVIQLLEPN